MKLLVFTVLILASIVTAEKKSYVGYSVHKLAPKCEEDINVLSEIQNNGIGEFWEDQFHINYEIRVMVPPQNRDIYNEVIQNTKMESREIINDLQRTVDEQLKPTQRYNIRNESLFSMTWDRYHTLEEIYSWFDELQSAYRNVVNITSIGHSVENREIKGIVINYKPMTNELIGFLEGTLHAREWISAATLTWVIKEFLTSNNREVRALAENFEWHIFPVVNPDGYVYTFTTNRMWRKNRSRQSFTSCNATGVDDDMSNGVDLNRNFDFVWNTVGASSNPCLNTFAGPSAFSEPEAQLLANYVLTLNNKGRLIYFLGFHSYTQLIVVPFSHVSGNDVLMASNYADMFEIAKRSADKLEQRFGTKYRVGVSADILYPMSGTSFDWVKNITDLPVSYLIELRDLGEYGFLLPAEQIIPNNLEIMDALLEMDRVTRKLGYYSFSGSSSIAYSLSLVVLSLVVTLIKL